MLVIGWALPSMTAPGRSHWPLTAVGMELLGEGSSFFGLTAGPAESFAVALCGLPGCDCAGTGRPGFVGGDDGEYSDQQAPVMSLGALRRVEGD